MTIATSEPRARQLALRAAVVVVAPAVLFAGFVAHPYVANATDAEAIADAVVADTTRWGIAHLVSGVGYALMVLAFLAIRSHLREVGEERWSSLALPLAAFGSALFVILPGMEFAPLAAAKTDGDVEGAQDELMPWFLAMFVTAAITFSLGILAFANAIARSGVLSTQLRRIVVGALVVMVAARFVPVGAAQIVVGAAAIVALWPFAYVRPSGESATKSWLPQRQPSGDSSCTAYVEHATLVRGSRPT